MRERVGSLGIPAGLSGDSSTRGGPPLVRVRGLCISIGPASANHVVDKLDLDVSAGETLCIVGESGCGKSVTALSLMGLTAPSVHVAAETLEVCGTELLSCRKSELAALRGNAMAMIFQEPMTSLNPSHRIGAQIREIIERHQRVSRRQADAQVQDLLARVGIVAPTQCARSYPHQLSGGMRQRVMIAMALANSPRLLIADEPTTALDVTIQRQILSLINQIKTETGTSVILITHDLGVVAQMADRVAVMYAGRIVETARVEQIFSEPRHPYTLGLLASIPRHAHRGDRLIPIDGTVPGFDEMPAGCRFASRCPFADTVCWQRRPPRVAPVPGHEVECWKLEELA